MVRSLESITYNQICRIEMWKYKSIALFLLHISPYCNTCSLLNQTLNCSFDVCLTYGNLFRIKGVNSRFGEYEFDPYIYGSRLLFLLFAIFNICVVATQIAPSERLGKPGAVKAKLTPVPGLACPTELMYFCHQSLK